MKIKKLADWLVDEKQYQISERPHAIFQSEVFIKELIVKSNKKDKKNEGKSDLQEE